MEGGGGRLYSKSTFSYGNVKFLSDGPGVGGRGHAANQLSHMAMLTYLMDR